jgi:DNA mismatch repair protein MSH6
LSFDLHEWLAHAGETGKLLCRFYEMFEMDAFVGVECLGLQFMKGEQPHAGFPEAAYFTMAEKLARAGHRVVVVEQVPP